MLEENEQLLEKFSDLLSRLEDMEELEEQERHAQFKKLQQDGSLEFNGVDVRRFAPPTNQQLSPGQFLRRTRRRLANTTKMIDQFHKRGAFEEGGDLRVEIDLLTGSIIDESNTQQIMQFRDQVDEIRNSELFKGYQDTKQQFIREDKAFRTEAEIAATKESVEDNQEILEERGQRISTIGQEMDNGDITPEKAQEQMDGIALPEGDA